MTFLPGTQIEIVNAAIPRGQIRSALFDFDGTLSLIREGWQAIMIPMMVEILLELKTDESEAELTAVVTEFVERLTGKQTIYQMIELCAQIERRGGTPLDPLAYKRLYLDRLWARIAHRVEGLKTGRIAPTEMIVPGAFEALENLQSRGITMYLASGTDQPYVLDEAQALGLTPYFVDGLTPGHRVFGAVDEYKRFSKAMIIQNILRDHGLSGEHLLTLGDGFVEIEETKKVGGIAIGAATNEATRQGIDEWKRRRLIEAGADVIIPDFREQDALITYLFDQ